MKLEPGDFAGFAEEDLEQMEYNAKDGFRLARSTCMHAQQYAEKMIKDRIVQIDSDEPPKTHDLVVLLRILKPSDGEIDEDILHKASILTYYYMGSRYPDFDVKEEMTEDAAEEAYRWSLEIVDYISRIIKDEVGKLRIEAITEEGCGDDSPRVNVFRLLTLCSVRCESLYRYVRTNLCLEGQPPSWIHLESVPFQRMKLCFETINGASDALQPIQKGADVVIFGAAIVTDRVVEG